MALRQPRLNYTATDALSELSNLFLQYKVLEANKKEKKELTELNMISMITESRLNRADKQYDALYEEVEVLQDTYEETTGQLFALNELNTTALAGDISKDITGKPLQQLTNELKLTHENIRKLRSDKAEIKRRIGLAKTAQDYYTGIGHDWKGGTDPAGWDLKDFEDNWDKYVTEHAPELEGIQAEPFIIGARKKQEALLPINILTLNKQIDEALTAKIEQSSKALKFEEARWDVVEDRIKDRDTAMHMKMISPARQSSMNMQAVGGVINLQNILTDLVASKASQGEIDIATQNIDKGYINIGAMITGMYGEDEDTINQNFMMGKAIVDGNSRYIDALNSTEDLSATDFIGWAEAMEDVFYASSGMESRFQEMINSAPDEEQKQLLMQERQQYRFGVSQVLGMDYQRFHESFYPVIHIGMESQRQDRNMLILRQMGNAVNTGVGDTEAPINQSLNLFKDINQEEILQSHWDEMPEEDKKEFYNNDFQNYVQDYTAKANIIPPWGMPATPDVEHVISDDKIDTSYGPQPRTPSGVEIKHEEKLQNVATEAESIMDITDYNDIPVEHRNIATVMSANARNKELMESGPVHPDRLEEVGVFGGAIRGSGSPLYKSHEEFQSELNYGKATMLAKKFGEALDIPIFQEGFMNLTPLTQEQRHEIWDRASAKAEDIFQKMLTLGMTRDETFFLVNKYLATSQFSINDWVLEGDKIYNKHDRRRYNIDEYPVTYAGMDEDDPNYQAGLNAMEKFVSEFGAEGGRNFFRSLTPEMLEEIRANDPEGWWTGTWIDDLNNLLKSTGRIDRNTQPAINALALFGEDEETLEGVAPRMVGGKGGYGTMDATSLTELDVTMYDIEHQPVYWIGENRGDPFHEFDPRTPAEKGLHMGKADYELYKDGLDLLMGRGFSKGIDY